VVAGLRDPGCTHCLAIHPDERADQVVIRGISRKANATAFISLAERGGPGVSVVMFGDRR
jgi:hypothetical protein